MGRTWLRAPGITDDSACAMARNAARSSENARDPPRRRERLEIRSLADSQAPLYFIRLSCEKRGNPKSKAHTRTNISVSSKTKQKKIVASLHILCNCDYVKFSPPIEAEHRCAKINLVSNIEIFSVAFFY